MSCQHFWVDRTDGHEEQCLPVVCLFCGNYGCYCDLKESLSDLPEKETQRRRTLAKLLGFPGDQHKLEKSLE